MKGKAKRYEYDPLKEARTMEIRIKAAMEAAKTAFKEAKAAHDAISVLVSNLEMQAAIKEAANSVKGGK